MAIHGCQHKCHAHCNQQKCTLSGPPQKAGVFVVVGQPRVEQNSRLVEGKKNWAVGSGQCLFGVGHWEANRENEEKYGHFI